jgi:WD40 repeat protein
VFQKGEKGGRQVNCLLVVQSAEDPLIMASSEDNLLRVWSSTFEERLRISMLKEEHEDKKVADNNRSLQSLTLLDHQDLLLLAATRNSEIVELMLGRQGIKGREVEERVLIRFSGGDGVQGKGKALLAHHPRYEVVATLGEDQVVMFWDCERRKLLHMNELGLDRESTKPTVLRFSYNGDYLIIGFSDGLLVFLDSKISRNMQSRGDEKYSQPSLKTVFKEREEEGWSVVGIELSEGGEFMAVSYHKLARGTNKRSISEVKIFASRGGGHKLRPNKFENEKVYELHSTVDNPHLDHVYTTASGLSCGFAAVSMTFAEYEGSHYLLMFFQLLDQNQEKVWAAAGDEDLKYKIRHVNNKTDSANTSSLNELIRWKKPHIFAALGAHYLLYEQPHHSQPQNNHLRRPQFTVADLLDGHLLLGSENGDLHLLGTSAVEQGGVAITVPAHCCKVNQAEHSQDRSALYTTGQSDHCILRWVIEPNLNPPAQQALDDRCDLFTEIPPQEYLLSRLAAYQEHYKRPKQGAQKLARRIRLHDIMGRRAYGVRNNLRADKQGRVVYHSGQAVVVADLQQHSKEFLHLRGQPLEEVSLLEMSEDGDLLVVAYAGVRTAVMVWSLSSKLLLAEVFLEELVRIVYMAVSHDHGRLLLYGLRGKDGEGCLMLVDLFNRAVLATATYLHKENWQVKGIAFGPLSHDHFATCGVEPVKLWHLCGQQLLYSALPPPDPSRLEPNRIHTCLVYAGQLLITGTDDGQLVLWKKEPWVEAAHQHMVTCLAVLQEGEDCVRLASGSEASLEGDCYQVLLWTLSKDELRQVRQVSAHHDLLNVSSLLGGRVSSRYESELEVQSLCFCGDQLLIGLLKGDVYRYPCKWAGGKAEEHEADRLMAFEDNESTKALFFTSGNDRLVDISERGLLRIWQFPALQLLWCRHFEAEVVDMAYSSLHEQVIVAFRGQLRFLSWAEQQMALEELEERTIQFNFLTHLLLSQSQKLLALGIESNSDKSHLVEIYELSSKDFKMRLRMKFDSPIEYLDFTRNPGEKNHFLIKSAQRLELYDISDLTQPLEVASLNAPKQDWMGQGLRIADKTKRARDAHCELAGEGPAIIRLALLKECTLIVDSTGAVFLFREEELLERSVLGMGSAECANLSSARWLGVASAEDRNLVVWELACE